VNLASFLFFLFPKFVLQNVNELVSFPYYGAAKVTIIPVAANPPPKKTKDQFATPGAACLNKTAGAPNKTVMNFAVKAGAKVIAFLYSAKHFSFLLKTFFRKKLDMVAC